MMPDIYLREAEKADCRFIWEVANDSEVREVSFSSEKIPWKEHQKWFNDKLQSSNCIFFIIETSSGDSLGQIRFELSSEDWVISLSIAKSFRGQGLGCKIVRMGSRLFFKYKSQIDTINAYIKNDNGASIRVFEKSGYTTVGSASINSENDAIHMILKESNLDMI